jgi:hypothetical protein
LAGSALLASAGFGDSVNSAIRVNPQLTYHDGPPIGMDVTKTTSHRIDTLEKERQIHTEIVNNLTNRIKRLEKMVEKLLESQSGAHTG